MSTRRLALMIIVLLFLPARSMAGGPVHGARAAGMGTAFVAVASDPSAILFNPAGIAQIRGTRVYGGNSALTINSDYLDRAGRTEETDFRAYFPPHFYITTDLGRDDLAFGLGVYAPFGIGGRTWPQNGLTRFTSTRAEIATLSVNPTVGVKLTPHVMVGAGFDYMGAYSLSERMLDQGAFGAGDGKLRLKGDGYGMGFNAGVIARLKGLSIGLAYRSEIEVDIDGQLEMESIAPPLQAAFGGPEFSTDARTRIAFPEIWSLGLAYAIGQDFTIALDYELVKWSGVNQTDLDLAREVPSAGLTDGTTTLNWKDSSQVKAGFEYKLTSALAIRGGYAFISTFVPEHSLEAGNPDSNQHNVSVGLGYALGKRAVLDLFYNAGFFEKRKINNSILSGEYDSFIQYAGFSVGYSF